MRPKLSPSRHYSSARFKRGSRAYCARFMLHTLPTLSRRFVVPETPREFDESRERRRREIESLARASHQRAVTSTPGLCTHATAIHEWWGRTRRCYLAGLKCYFKRCYTARYYCPAITSPTTLFEPTRVSAAMCNSENERRASEQTRNTGQVS